METSDRLVEILATILESCGALDGQSEENSSWDLLAVSLGELSAALDILKRNYQEFDHGEDYETLLSLEEAAQNVRTHSRALSNQLRQHPEGIRHCQDLETLCLQTEFFQFLPLSICLRNTFRNQINDVHATLGTIDLGLDSLHCLTSQESVDLPDMAQDFRNAAMKIKKRCVDIKGSPLSEVVELIHATNGDDRAISVSRSIPRTPGVIAKGSALVGDRLSEENTGDLSKPVLSHLPLLDIVENFISSEPAQLPLCQTYLLVGPEGSGKSSHCHQIETLARGRVHVIRPNLPYDAMGELVGSAEDVVFSMFTFAKSRSEPVIVLIDDVECLFGIPDHGPSLSAIGDSSTGTKVREPHLTARVRSVLLAVLEVVRGMAGAPILLLCTSHINIGRDVDRFDRVFTLGAPTAEERRELLQDHLPLFQQGRTHTAQPDPPTEALLENIVECTSGLSQSELAQLCRSAVCSVRSDRPESGTYFDFLQGLQHQLQMSVPESVKNGVNADFVDMHVMTARDLRIPSDATTESPPGLNLFGKEMEAAWEELKRSIVLPICQAKKLHELMHRDGVAGGKVFAGGVLLTGDSGCGKSALAYHCAAYASSLNPAVKLLDVSCTSLIHKEVGGSEQSIHRLFRSAQAAAPCILLLDGIENIAAVRGNDNTTEGTLDRVLSTLLTELDGVDSEHFNVENPACLAIIGVTHNASWIDPALCRPGRLDRVVELGPLELEARRKLANRELRSSLDPDHATLDDIVEHIAATTNGGSGAQVVAACDNHKLASSYSPVQTSSYGHHNA